MELIERKSNKTLGSGSKMGFLRGRRFELKAVVPNASCHSLGPHALMALVLLDVVFVTGRYALPSMLEDICD